MHVSEFCLEQFPDRLAGAHLTVTKLDQFSDLPKREAEPLHLPDEAKSLDGIFRVQPEPARTSRYFRQQFAPFVEPDRIDGQGCPFCDFANLDDLATSLMIRSHDHTTWSIVQSQARRNRLGGCWALCAFGQRPWGCGGLLLGFHECGSRVVGFKRPAARFG